MDEEPRFCDFTLKTLFITITLNSASNKNTNENTCLFFSQGYYKFLDGVEKISRVFFLTQSIMLS